MTVLLSLKPALTHFAAGLLVTEVRAAVMLALLAFVIYPVLPDHTAGAAATLAIHKNIDMQTAGLGVVLTSMASALSNLPLLHHQILQWAVTRRVVLASCFIVVVGLVAVFTVRALLTK